MPVLGQYDVVVIGGGTGGAPAGIGAARQGAKTLVVEYLHGLGGVGTLGAISSYYWGNRVGFTATVGGGQQAGSSSRRWNGTGSELLEGRGRNLVRRDRLRGVRRGQPRASAPWWPRPTAAAWCWPRP